MERVDRRPVCLLRRGAPIRPRQYGVSLKRADGSGDGPALASGEGADGPFGEVQRRAVGRVEHEVSDVGEVALGDVGDMRCGVFEVELPIRHVADEVLRCWGDGGHEVAGDNQLAGVLAEGKLLAWCLGRS